MAYSVEGAFDAFYEKINLNGDYRDTANSRRDRLVSLLKKDFDVLDAFFRLDRYRGLPPFKGHSDLDIMVVLHFGKHIQNKTLSRFSKHCGTVAEYKTGIIRKNGQAVTLGYEIWPNVDIVPVSRSVNSAKQVTHYNAEHEHW